MNSRFDVQTSFLCSQHLTGFVVSTHLKTISQHGNLPQIGVKIKSLWNNHPAKGFFRYELMAHDSSHQSLGSKTCRTFWPIDPGQSTPPRMHGVCKTMKTLRITPKKGHVDTLCHSFCGRGNTPNTDILFASWSSYPLAFCKKTHVKLLYALFFHSPFPALTAGIPWVPHSPHRWCGDYID